MRRRPEDITLSATASGVMLVISAVVLLIIYAMFMAMHLASPLVGRNFAGLF